MAASGLHMAGKGTDLYIGTAGWSYDDWQGTVYPKERPGGFRELSFLARYFNTVEINMSFYRPPPADYAQRWVEDVRERPDFQFTAKLWRRFTHERDEWWQPRESDMFRAGMDPLMTEGKLGAVLAQFPYSFHYGDVARDWLTELTREFTEYPLVVEVRSHEWLGDEPLDFLRGLGVGFCNIDQPAVSGNIPLTDYGFGSTGYLRMHGRNEAAWFDEESGRDERYDYLYSPEELDQIEDAIAKIAERVEKMYVIANNHYRGQAPANALQLMGRLTGEEPEPPEDLASLTWRRPGN